MTDGVPLGIAWASPIKELSRQMQQQLLFIIWHMFLEGKNDASRALLGKNLLNASRADSCEFPSVPSKRVFPLWEELPFGFPWVR